MRPFWTAFLILGIFHPLVIQAEPFGTTEVSVYDADFLPAPEGPPPKSPDEPMVPAWVVLSIGQEPTAWVVPPILSTELPS